MNRRRGRPHPSSPRRHRAHRCVRARCRRRRPPSRAGRSAPARDRCCRPSTTRSPWSRSVRRGRRPRARRPACSPRSGWRAHDRRRRYRVRCGCWRRVHAPPSRGRRPRDGPGTRIRSGSAGGDAPHPARRGDAGVWPRVGWIRKSPGPRHGLVYYAVPARARLCSADRRGTHPRHRHRPCDDGDGGDDASSPHRSRPLRRRSPRRHPTLRCPRRRSRRYRRRPPRRPSCSWTVYPSCPTAGRPSSWRPTLPRPSHPRTQGRFRHRS